MRTLALLVSLGSLACGNVEVTGDAGAGNPDGSAADPDADTGGPDAAGGGPDGQLPPDAAQPPNIMFVTSTTHRAAMGGLIGADAICQARAGAAGLDGSYVAWLSTTTVNAIDRLAGARGWVRPDGKPFADRREDIAAGMIMYPPRVDETGAALGINDSSTWTATNDGILQDTACADWTSSDSGIYVVSGRATAGASMFSNSGQSQCSQLQRLYCFGIDHSAVVAPTPVTGRFAFMTSSAFIIGGGLAAADAKCQANADAASLPGSYRALLATNGTTAASRFSTGGPVWVRPDGLPLAADAASLFTAEYLDVALAMSASGTAIYPNYGLWIGANGLQTAGTQASTCASWTSTSGTGLGGVSGDTWVQQMVGFGGGYDCGAGYVRLLCLQQ